MGISVHFANDNVWLVSRAQAVARNEDGVIAWFVDCRLVCKGVVLLYSQGYTGRGADDLEKAVMVDRKMRFLGFA